MPITRGRPVGCSTSWPTQVRENLDVDHVALYDDKEDANADAEVELLRQLGLGERSTLVDLGAGTGQFTVAVAPMSARVVAVDISSVILDRLRVKLDTADSPTCGHRGTRQRRAVRDEQPTFASGLLEPMIERTGFRIEQAAYSIDDGFLGEYLARAV